MNPSGEGNQPQHNYILPSYFDQMRKDQKYEDLMHLINQKN